MEHLKEATLLIEDLTCRVCIRRVSDALRAQEGVVAVRVSTSPDLDPEQPGAAVVKYDPARTDLERLLKAVSNLGYFVHQLPSSAPSPRRSP